MEMDDKPIAAEWEDVPGILYIDHVAIAVPQGELERQLAAYAQLGFREIHREEVGGGDMVREALLQIGGGLNRIQLLEPLSAASPVQKLMDKNGGRGGFAHVAFRVKSAQRAFDYLKAKGFRIIDVRATGRLVRNHGVFRASQVAGRRWLWVFDRDGGGGGVGLRV